MNYEELILKIKEVKKGITFFPSEFSDVSDFAMLPLDGKSKSGEQSVSISIPLHKLDISKTCKN